jgi:hypothetical protein
MYHFKQLFIKRRRDTSSGRTAHSGSGNHWCTFNFQLLYPLLQTPDHALAFRDLLRKLPCLGDQKPVALRVPNALTADGGTGILAFVLNPPFSKAAL